mmetsp:Transcript_39472/g.101276  ORF Transcript_39472/g.101276 Transcript_39472/m.101276 type:complete len:381 (-) Transcript_39472:97-1239(-)
MIHQEKPFARLFGVDTLIDHPVADSIHHSKPSTTRTQHDVGLIFERKLSICFGGGERSSISATSEYVGKVICLCSEVGTAKSTHQACKCSCASTLDVIIEALHVVSVLIENRPGMSILEVLELNQHIRVSETNGSNEFVHNVVVLITSEARASKTKVAGIIPEVFIVSTDIEAHWEHSLRVDAASSTVEGQLPDGDSHTMHTEITETQYTGTICHHNDINIIGRPVVNHGRHVASVDSREIHTPAATEKGTELLACLSHGRGVNDGRNVFDVAQHKLIKDSFASILKGRDQLPLFQVIIQLIEVLSKALDLLLHVCHSGRQKTANAKPVSLFQGEASGFVEPHIIQQVHANALYSLRLHPVHSIFQRIHSVLWRDTCYTR